MAGLLAVHCAVSWRGFKTALTPTLHGFLFANLCHLQATDKPGGLDRQEPMARAPPPSPTSLQRPLPGSTGLPTHSLRRRREEGKKKEKEKERKRKRKRGAIVVLWCALIDGHAARAGSNEWMES